MNNEQQYEHFKNEVKTSFSNYINAVEDSTFESIANAGMLYTLNLLQSKCTQANLNFKNFIFRHSVM